MADSKWWTKRWVWPVVFFMSMMMVVCVYQVYSARAVVDWLWGKRSITLNRVTVIVDGRETVITDPTILRNIETAFSNAYGSSSDRRFIRDATLRVDARGLLPVDLRISYWSDGTLTVWDSPLGGLDDVWHDVPNSDLLWGMKNPIITAIVP